MIEVNRCLYMEEQPGLKNRYFAQVRDNVRKLIETVACLTAQQAIGP